MAVLEMRNFVSDSRRRGAAKFDSMGQTKSPKTSRRRRAPYGVTRDKTSIPELWRDMWAGTAETNRRLRWRRWDRDLDFS